MRASPRSNAAVAAIMLMGFAMSVNADLTNLPELSTATKKTSSASSTSATTGSSTTGGTSTSGASTTGTATTSSSVYHLTGLPTVAGAGIPTLVVPDTSAAPFMQKSTLPEGTVFIVVGAVLAFLGFCVLAWRGLVAWSINRSVKKAALASIMASDTKTSGTGWNPLSKPSRGLYSHAPDGSSLSLDHLTSTGKPVNASTRASRVPPPANAPQNLFFSPTASAAPSLQLSPYGAGQGNRSSTFLPSGYYASPSAAPAGGATTTVLGGGARRSYVDTTPPASPGPHQRISRRMSSNNNLGLQPGSRDGSRGPSRPGSTLNPGLNTYASNSSLGVYTGHGEEGGERRLSRAPSAYLEDLFEGNGRGLSR